MRKQRWQIAGTSWARTALREILWLPSIIMNTKAPDYIKQIEAAGWDAIKADTFSDCEVSYRATQGSFSTPWLSSWKDVWEWVTGKEKECI